MSALTEWGETFLLESECDTYLSTHTEISHCNVIKRRKAFIAQTITEAQEAEIKEENLLPAKIDAFEVTDFETLTLKQDGE